MRRRIDQNGVGQSHRTRSKHDVLDGMLKVESKVLTRTAHPIPLLIDLCAGDGRPQTESFRRSSPILMLCRGMEAERRCGRTYVWLYERNRRTHADLLLSTHPDYTPAQPRRGVAVVHGDSRIEVPLTPIPADVGHIFIFNDPNSIDTQALTNEILDHCYAHTPMVATLSAIGANVGGARRKLTDQRYTPAQHEEFLDEWRDCYWLPRDHQEAREQIAYGHDTLIVARRNDGSRWGYVLSCAAVLRDYYEDVVTRAFGADRIEFAWAGLEFARYHHIVTQILVERPKSPTEGR